MASGAAMTMKTSLVLMLVLGAVVAAHGNSVSCTNTCPAPITLGGVKVGVGLTVKLHIKAVVELSVIDKLKGQLFAIITVPVDVTALLVVYEEGLLKVKVAAVVKVKGVVATLFGTVLGSLVCVL